MAIILTGTTVMAPSIEVFVQVAILCGDYQYGGYVITDLRKGIFTIIGEHSKFAKICNQVTSPDDGTVPIVHFMEPCTGEMMVCLHLLRSYGEENI